MSERFDVVVMGSGAAGLTAALVAANAGADVLVLERSPLFGGTTAISGGQVWVPNNPHMKTQGWPDSRDAVLTYLQQVTLGSVDPVLVDAFIDTAPRMIEFLEEATRLRFFMVERPDYHSQWNGAAFGRSLEPQPFGLNSLGTAAASLRRSPHRPPLTSAEIKRGQGADLIDRRLIANEATQGAALVAGLVEACIAKGVQIRNNSRVVDLIRSDNAVAGVRLSDGAPDARAATVVIASGGFEWNEALKRAFLRCPDEGAASPPWNEGDGLKIGLRAGAAVGTMTESWWSAAFAKPGEAYDARKLTRNIVKELALPGSVLVNEDGRRFVNEASSYNALGKAFQIFDPGRNKYINKRAWLIFDQRFKDTYPVATISPDQPAPDWFLQGSTLVELAAACGIDSDGLMISVRRFNGFAAAGKDLEFFRGDAAHDRYHGDTTALHPNLGSIESGPFYALPIFLGNLGTKGGMRTDENCQVISQNGDKITGLYACGNAAESWMGPGYPGAGGSLGPIMTAAFRCGNAVARASTANRLN